jgi:hypothetical protein
MQICLQKIEGKTRYSLGVALKKWCKVLERKYFENDWEKDSMLALVREKEE